MGDSSFAAARKEHWKILGESMVRVLTARGFQTTYVPSKEDALKEVYRIIPEGATVGVPGSITIREIGAIEGLRSRGCTVMHHWDPSLTPEQRAQTLQDELLAQYFLTSTNALTLDGTLVNIDGNGNRVSGMAWGRNTLIFVVGMNKITKSLDDAIARTRNVATPQNALRQKYTPPCTTTGYCVNCNSETRVCKAILILERATTGRTSHVILVGEDLGF